MKLLSVSPEIYYDHTDIIRHIQTQPYDSSIQLTVKGQQFNCRNHRMHFENIELFGSLVKKIDLYLFNTTFIYIYKYFKFVKDLFKSHHHHRRRLRQELL